MAQGKLKVQKTARYFTSGNLSQQTKNVWVVLHGYGQLANYFLLKFENLVNPTTCVIAPEGLNRFYIRGVEGRVKATWMTKEDRLDDIEDYVNYLNQLTTEIILKQAPNAKIHVIGFSQGGATASRWLAAGQHHASTLVFWASTFPRDTDFNLTAQTLKNTQVIVVVGDKDEFINEERLKESTDNLNAKGIQFDLIRFKGNHTIEPAVFSQLMPLIEI